MSVRLLSDAEVEAEYRRRFSSFKLVTLTDDKGVHGLAFKGPFTLPDYIRQSAEAHGLAVWYKNGVPGIYHIIDGDKVTRDELEAFALDVLTHR